MKKYQIEAYIAENGKVPFQDWLAGLKDSIAQTKVYARLDRASYGNFGDHKPIKGTKGLFEMRDRHGAGLRIYYTIIDAKIVLLLAGSTKKDQNKVIAKAKQYLEDLNND
ncbi:MAG: type II toxin-antitoxin system RelE/ParE family toxin [Alphaproteobacteria bacterium]|nr:type II toxin-antitoxin system RelE/ParE family toxin [Alphaproteobacteria bacterium]